MDNWEKLTFGQLYAVPTLELKLLLTAVHWHSVKLLVICSGGVKIINYDDRRNTKRRYCFH
jgi:hypothetical protein